MLPCTLLVMYGFARERQTQAICYELEVSIDRPANSDFIDEKDLRHLFMENGIAPEGAKLQNIPIRRLEELARNHPSVASAEVYITTDGRVVVRLRERTPIVRIFNSHAESFYLDEKGGLMPLSNRHTARVLLASGEIDVPMKNVVHLEEMEKTVRRLLRRRNNSAMQNAEMAFRLHLKDTLPGTGQLMQLFSLAKLISADRFWNAQISQLYVEENGDFVLVPRVGNHLIIMGAATDLPEKFSKLRLFYRKGLSRIGWNEFQTVNLSFKNQIVCTKRQEI